MATVNFDVQFAENAYTVQFEETSMELDAQFEPNGGGGGTSNYNQLSNKPSINNVTLSGNKTASDLGLGTYSKPSGGIPASDLASAVQTSLGKADTALQSAPVSSVNSKTGAVVLNAGDLAYDSTATYSSGTVGDELSDLKGDLNSKLSSNQGSGNAGKWLTIANDGTVTAASLPVYSGGVS